MPSVPRLFAFLLVVPQEICVGLRTNHDPPEAIAASYNFEINVWISTIIPTQIRTSFPGLFR